MIRTLVVVGSGGHTMEMMKLVGSLSDKYVPRIYVVADTDQRSVKKVEEFELNRTEVCQHAYVRIKRSREVGQSWFTTFFTTLAACFHAISIIWRHRPKLLLCNGPGTCIPLCGAVLLLRMMCLTSTKIIYVESICRVQSLSLSGKILYYLADHILVQWKELQQKYPRTQYIGRLT